MTLRRLLRLLRAGNSDRDVDDELQHHIDLEAAEIAKTGVHPEEARRRALLAFGGIQSVRAEAREIQRPAAVEAWLRDIGQSVRLLCHQPAFSLTVAAVVAVGTGGLIAVFTMLNAVVLNPLPFPQPDRLVLIKHASAGLKLNETGISSGLYFHYRQNARSIESIGLYTERLLTFRRGDHGPERIHVSNVTVSFFEVFRAKPALGRLFVQEDARPGFMDTQWPIPVVLAHEFWKSHFGSDRDVVGKTVTINDRPRLVIGVVEPQFAFPRQETQLWMLSEPPVQTANLVRNLEYAAVARLRSGVTIASVESELSDLLPRVIGLYDDATPERFAQLALRPIVLPLRAAIIGDVADVIVLLLGAMVLLLLIACANATGLFLIRANDRRGEVTIRLAMGAQARHVSRLFIIEALLLTGAGTALGLLVAAGLLSAVVASAADALPRATEIRIGVMPAGFAAAVALALAVFFAWLSVRKQEQPRSIVLSSGARTTRLRKRRWVGEPLITLQVALALTLMVGSALMLKTYLDLSNVALGFVPSDLVAVEIDLPSGRSTAHARIYTDVVSRIREIPGVDSAASASFVPLTSSEHLFPVTFGGAPVLFKFFTPGYFETMQSPVVDGDTLSDGNRSGFEHPVLISAGLARRLFGSQDALGKSLSRFGADGRQVELFSGPIPPFTVVGVVADVREAALRQTGTEIVYVPVLGSPVEQAITPLRMTLLVRTHLSPPPITAAIKQIVREVEPSLSVGTGKTMDSVVQSAKAREAFVGTLLLSASAASLFLGLVGIYGTVGNSVRHRTREIGVRLALGGRPTEVLAVVVAGSLWSVIAGCGLGVLVAVAASRTLSSLLFGMQSGDMYVLSGTTMLMLLAAFTSALLGGRKVVTLSPLVALRTD